MQARADLKQLSLRKDPRAAIPKLGGPVAEAFKINYEFINRGAMEIVGMHSELQCGVSVHTFGADNENIATAMVSGDGHANRDLGGLAEKYMGTDTVVLAGKRREYPKKAN